MPDPTEQSDGAGTGAPKLTAIGLADGAGRGGSGAGRRGVLGSSGDRARSWARRALARDRVVGSLRTLLWVAPLTLLIWVYAEREQTASVANVKVGIDVTSTDPGTLVTLAPKAT